MTVPPCAGTCPVVELLTIDLARRGVPEAVTRLGVPEAVTRLGVGIDQAAGVPTQTRPRMPAIPPPCDDGDYLTGHQERP